MPIRKGKYKCKLCDDIFETIPDEFTKCKCGESKILTSGLGYKYRNGNQVETIETIEYYLEDEFVKLPQDILDILTKYDELKEKLGYKISYYKWHKPGEHGEKYLSDIKVSYRESLSTYSSEANEISLNIHLSTNDYRGHEETKERLSKFLNLMDDIINGNFKLSNRRSVIEWSDKEDIYYQKELTEEYDYTFYL